MVKVLHMNLTFGEDLRSLGLIRSCRGRPTLKSITRLSPNVTGSVQHHDIMTSSFSEFKSHKGVLLLLSHHWAGGHRGRTIGGP